ncbi:uncharacterized protein LOC141906035 [Tubulanus polymorphus]|uniref:uncharacterized protein LOC141906035 n=1 Tax=Tubulanus polymorphus TaxID=672921 RepID=UPI003DA3A512
MAAATAMSHSAAGSPAGGAASGTPMMMEEMIPVNTIKTPNKIYLKPIKRAQGKADRERELKHQYLRAQQPMLTKPDTSIYRNSYLHNLCLDMLEKGFHRSFSELFALVNQQRADRERAGPDSITWNQVLLEDEHDKLNVLQQYLTEAESGGRRGNPKVVYKSLHELARYFQQTSDKWLSDHFFSQCLSISSQVTDDDNLTLSEGHCNMGLAVEENGDYSNAAEHFESYHELTLNHDDWLNNNDQTLHAEACNHLVRIYTTIAYKLEPTDESQCLEYLLKAYNMAQEGGDKKLEGEASYRLGQGYEKTADAETALVYLMRFFEMCQELKDDDGLGLACEALAQAYQRQEKIDETIKYLKMFVEVAERSENKKAVSRACSDLGAVFNSLSQYEEAAMYFTKAYDIARAMNDKEAISSSRVQYGIAMAHKMMYRVSKHVNHANRPCMERLVDWKNNRNSSFDSPIPATDEVKPEENVTEPETEDANVNDNENEEKIENKEEIVEEPVTVEESTQEQELSEQ